jgi:hypothetical protein
MSIDGPMPQLLIHALISSFGQKALTNESFHRGETVQNLLSHLRDFSAAEADRYAAYYSAEIHRSYPGKLEGTFTFLVACA